MKHTIKVKLFMVDEVNNKISGVVIERDGIEVNEDILDCGNHVAVCRDIVCDADIDIDDKIVTITISQGE